VNKKPNDGQESVDRSKIESERASPDQPGSTQERKLFTLFPRDATAKEIMEGLKKLKERADR